MGAKKGFSIFHSYYVLGPFIYSRSFNPHIYPGRQVLLTLFYNKKIEAYN